MPTPDDDIFADLQDDLDTHASAPAAPARAKPKHPCGQCGGTGRWSRGINRRGEGKCYACKGTGYFKSSQADRQKARDQRRARKARKIAEAQQSFAEEHPGLIDALQAIADWNGFAGSMVQAYAQYGHLTERQVVASRNMLAKIEQTRLEREAQKAANAVTVDLSSIRAMFDVAMGNGLKRPTYRAEGLVISLAPASGRNAGHMYVKTIEGEYQGKISPDHQFHPVRSVEETTKIALLTIAADPKAAAIRYGRLLGNCSVCGRLLTNQDSIDAGIGPICASRFGF